MILNIYLLYLDTGKPSFYEVPTIRVSIFVLILIKSKRRIFIIN